MAVHRWVLTGRRYENFGLGCCMNFRGDYSGSMAEVEGELTIMKVTVFHEKTFFSTLNKFPQSVVFSNHKRHV